MASLVHLVRHAEVANPAGVVYGRLAGFGLSDRGAEQARLAALRFRGRPLTAVWSSPLQRALQTAEVIAAEAGLTVRVDPALSEWRLSDQWEGRRWSDLPSARPGELEAYLGNPEELPFATESLTQLAARVTEAIVAINRRHPVGEVVVVGHQDPTQAARLVLTGRRLAALHEDKPGHGSAITLRPGEPWVELGDAAGGPDG